jgi:F-type H+-transporting ATPase subunit delta
MRGSAVARNYAATLFDLAARNGSESLFSDLIEGVGELYSQNVALQRFLDAPSITSSAKKGVLQQAFDEHAPDLFVRFLLVLVDRRRQRLLPDIAAAYRELLDKNANRVRATVTLPFEADEVVQTEIMATLKRHFDKKVIPEFHVDERILGGVIIRVGDALLDASVRRQFEQLRRELQQGAPQAKFAFQSTSTEKFRQSQEETT